MPIIILVRIEECKYMSDYIRFLEKERKAPVWVLPNFSLSTIQMLPLSTEDTVIFVQRAPAEETIINLIPRTKQIYFLNTEQITRQEPWVPIHHLNKMLESFPQTKGIDYSATNIALQKDILRNRYEHWKYQPNPLPVFPAPNRQIIFIGTLNPRRQNIINQLPHVTILQNVYGAERNKIIADHHILLNIHFLPNYRIFEELRCNQWIVQGMTVVSEISNNPSQEKYPKNVHFVPYENLVQTVKYLLTTILT